jgi:protein SCO1/2
VRALAFALLLPTPARAAVPPTGGPLAAATVEEHRGARLPLGLAFTDESGRRVRIGDLFADGRPVVLTFAYFRCTMLCPMVLHGTAAAAGALDAERDFRLVTVSIDPRDTPEDARRMHAMLRGAAGGAGDGWRFLTGPPAAVRALAESIGFGYAYDRVSGQYAHPAALFVLGPTGTVAGYLYGTSFAPAELDAALAAAARGEDAPAFERFLLRCFHYTPALRRYASAIAWGLRAGAALLLVAAAGGLALLVRRSTRTREAR